MPRPSYDRTTRPGRPRLLLFETDVQARLQAVAWLRDHYEVVVPPEGAEPVRTARSEKPELVLIAIPDRRPKASLRACRVLKSEPNPPMVGLINRGRARMDPDELMSAQRADGYLEGTPSQGELEAWLDAVYRGDRPVQILGRRGLLGRIRRRLF